MTAKHADPGRGADQTVASVPRQALPDQAVGDRGAGSLMFLVAALLVGSALTSLTLLWFAVRAIQWLWLHG